MTRARKWGLQWSDGDWYSSVCSSANTLDEATLFDSAHEAAGRSYPYVGKPKVREVIVEEVEGDWILGCVVRADEDDCPGDGYVVAMQHRQGGEWCFIDNPGLSTSEKEHAIIYATKASALAAMVEYRKRNPSGAWARYHLGVHTIHRKAPHEVRHAGRTLDEVLESVPVEGDCNDA